MTKEKFIEDFNDSTLRLVRTSFILFCVNAGLYVHKYLKHLSQFKRSDIEWVRVSKFLTSNKMAKLKEDILNSVSSLRSDTHQLMHQIYNMRSEQPITKDMLVICPNYNDRLVEIEAFVKDIDRRVDNFLRFKIDQENNNLFAGGNDDLLLDSNKKNNTVNDALDFKNYATDISIKLMRGYFTAFGPEDDEIPNMLYLLATPVFDVDLNRFNLNRIFDLTLRHFCEDVIEPLFLANNNELDYETVTNLIREVLRVYSNAAEYIDVLCNRIKDFKKDYLNMCEPKGLIE